jgi:hypothetical protein
MENRGEKREGGGGGDWSLASLLNITHAVLLHGSKKKGLEFGRLRSWFVQQSRDNA